MGSTTNTIRVAKCGGDLAGGKDEMLDGPKAEPDSRKQRPRRRPRTMKVRDIGMPHEADWESLFDVPPILSRFDTLFYAR
jgi:hypothetical protein